MVLHLTYTIINTFDKHECHPDNNIVMGVNNIQAQYIYYKLIMTTALQTLINTTVDTVIYASISTITRTLRLPQEVYEQ